MGLQRTRVAEPATRFIRSKRNGSTRGFMDRWREVGFSSVIFSPVTQPDEEDLTVCGRYARRSDKQKIARKCSMKTKRTASIYPTVDEINALPEKFRQYIHDLVTRCDKSGDVQTIAILREDRDALQRRVEELEARIAQQEREYLEAPIETD